MIGAELEFEAVEGGPLRRVHDTAVVDVQVDPRMGRAHLRSSSADRGWRTEIERLHLHVADDAGRCFRTLRDVSFRPTIRADDVTVGRNRVRVTSTPTWIRLSLAGR